jgi:hypothetical protein
MARLGVFDIQAPTSLNDAFVTGSGIHSVCCSVALFTGSPTRTKTGLNVGKHVVNLDSSVDTV